MKKTYLHFLFFLISFFFEIGNRDLGFAAYSQDKITLISGRTIDGKITSVGEDTICFKTEKKGKTKEEFIESYRVFSIQHNDGKEDVIYKYDSAGVNDRTVEELRDFIAGEQDALRGYKPWLATVLSFTLSGAAVFFLQGSFFIIAVPFVTYMAFLMLYKTSISKKTVLNPNLLQTPDYIEGYMRVAKNTKNRNAMWGSVLGAGAGFVTYLIVHNNSDF